MSTSTNRKLGEKIRVLRLKRGLTQKDLADGCITRSMLSLIESGATSPSVTTLRHLADRLGVPAGTFFADSPEEEDAFRKLALMPSLKKAFSDADYDGCLRLLDEAAITDEDDECSYIRAVSYLKTAERQADAYDFGLAAVSLSAAESAAAHSRYCGDSFDRAIRYRTVLMESACEDPAPDLLADTSMCSEWIPAALVQYFITLKLLKLGENSWFIFDGDDYPARHIRALKLLYDDQPYDAMRLLRDLADDPALPYFMQYRVLCDLEELCNQTGDVRLAYSASRRKLELIEKTKQ